MDYFLADDLSGALDAAAAFHHAGRRVRVLLSAAEWAGGRDDEVVGLTTETRNAPPAAAARTVLAAIARGRARGEKLLFKKIDSTLRGPIAAELAAVMEALPGVRILFAPANPRVGRTVRRGVLRVHGVPVAETDFARDPVCPVRESDIARLLGTVASPRVVIADAETEDDLDAAVARMEAEGGDWVAVGAGALARPVALVRRSGGNLPASGPAARVEHGQVDRASIAPSPVLLIGGSAHAANRVQIETLARECGVPVHEIVPGAAASAGRAAVASLRAHGSAALVVPAARIDGSAALQAMVEVATQVIREAGVRRLFATGGETAFALCGALGIPSLEFGAEIEAGLSISRGASRDGPMLLAVKPGGFGDARTWLRAWTELQAA